MSFDTTSANTGTKKSAAVELEALFERELLWLPCRHHIFELILQAVFSTEMGPSSGPEIKLFKDFQRDWPKIDQTHFSTILDCSEELISKQARENLIEFAQTYINVGQPRDDYLELLELTIIFLGGSPARGVRFSPPGPMHLARWMAKAIYSLKVWLFRNQLPQVKEQDLSGVLQINLFVVQVYIQAWYTSSDAISAPRNDLDMIKRLIAYENVNPTIALAAQKKMAAHLWYLSEVSMALALFDSSVSEEERQSIVDAMKSRSALDDPSRRKIVDDVGDLANINLSDFATTRTQRFFEILGLDTTYLDIEVQEWVTHSGYYKAWQTVNSLAVVNDHAERAIKLLQDYNKILTHSEKKFQEILIGVGAHRKSLPDVKKKSLIKKYGPRDA